MTKIKVDENGLNARPVNPYPKNRQVWDASKNMGKKPYRQAKNKAWIDFETTVKSHSLTEPAEPNLVCDGDLVWQIEDARDPTEWIIYAIEPDEFMKNQMYTRQAWHIVKPMQESSEIQQYYVSSLEDACDKYADDNPSELVCQKDFIAGATNQAPITKAETIEYVVRVIESYYNGLHSWQDADIKVLLSQIKNI